MTYENFINAISNDVSRILSENLENTLNGIISDISPSEHLKNEHLELCKNTVTVSVQMSVQIIFSYLDSLGMLNYENHVEHFEPPVLEVLKGGLSENLDYCFSLAGFEFVLQGQRLFSLMYSILS